MRALGRSKLHSRKKKEVVPQNQVSPEKYCEPFLSLYREMLSLYCNVSFVLISYVAPYNIYICEKDS